MTIARVIQTGETQTVELPEDVRLSGERVEVLQHNNEIILQIGRASCRERVSSPV